MTIIKNYKTLSGGYLKKTAYDGNIVYQDVSNCGALNYQPSVNSTDSLLSQRNFFTVTTRGGTDVTKTYKKTTFGNLFHTQQSIDNVLGNLNSELTINYDQTDLTKLCYYGSMSEYARVTVASVLEKWAASIFLKTNDYTEPTVTGGTYYSTLNQTIFNLNFDKISNPFDINTYDTASVVDDTKNFILNWNRYVVSVEDETSGLFSSGSTINDVTIETVFDAVLGVDVVTGIKLVVEGNPFGFVDMVESTSLLSYHIKPNAVEYVKFKESLIDFEKILLLNETVSEFYSDYTLKETNDEGTVQYKPVRLNWKRSDGYNIDYTGQNYEVFVSNLLEVTEYYDSFKTDIIYRFLVSENLLTFDSNNGSDYQNSEEAVIRFGNTLRIFGVFLDDIKKYIDGISYVNTLSYDNKNNLPTQLIKTQATLYGWDVFNMFEDISLEGVKNNNAFWKNLAINTPYIWGSKGTRKSVEFLLEYMGIPHGLIGFNEHVYVARDVVDYETVSNLYTVINGEDSEISVAIDENGFPVPLPNNSTRWFQSFGGWYRETGGLNSDYEINIGNNPHLGEYDDGRDYWLQFTNLIPNFTKTIVNNENIIAKTRTLFKFDHQNIFKNMKKWSLDTKTSVSWIENEIIVPTVDECGCILPTEDSVFRIIFGEEGNYGNIYTNQSQPCECGNIFNSRMVQAFTKNDCAVGYSGSTLEYVVEEGKYYECTVEAANALALADIEANGQTYANTNGTCGEIILFQWVVSGTTCGGSITGTAIDYETEEVFIPEETTKYILYIKQEKIADGDWFNLDEYRYTRLERYSYDCGYTQYQWVTSGTTCGSSIGLTGLTYPELTGFTVEETTQYNQFIYQEEIAEDTWVDIATGYTVADANSFDCGYVNMENIIRLTNGDSNDKAYGLISVDNQTNVLAIIYNDTRLRSKTILYQYPTGATIDVIEFDSNNWDDDGGDFYIKYMEIYGNVREFVCTNDSSLVPYTDTEIIEDVYIDNNTITMFSACGSYNDASRYEYPYKGNSNLTGITMTSRTTNLEYLYLAGNQNLTTIDLEYQINLKQLFLGNSGIITINNIPNSIEELHLIACYNLVTNDFSNLTNLKIFRGDNSDFEHYLNFENCESLIELNVGNLTGLTINDCTSLELLDVSNISDGLLLDSIFEELPSYVGTSITGFIEHQIGSPSGTTSIYEIKQWVKINSNVIDGVFVENFDYKLISDLGNMDRYIIKTDNIYDVNYPDVIYYNEETIYWDYTSKEWVRGEFTTDFDYTTINKLKTGDKYLISSATPIKDINFTGRTFEDDDIITWCDENVGWVSGGMLVRNFDYTTFGLTSGSTGLDFYIGQNDIYDINISGTTYNYGDVIYWGDTGQQWGTGVLTEDFDSTDSSFTGLTIGDKYTIMGVDIRDVNYFSIFHYGDVIEWQGTEFGWVVGEFNDNFDHSNITGLVVSDTYRINKEGVYDINFPETTYEVGDIIAWYETYWFKLN